MKREQQGKENVVNEKKTKVNKNEKKRKLAVRDDVLFLREFHPNYNADICKILTELGTIQKNLGLKHKYMAYTTAAGALAAYPKRIPSGAVAQKELDGVGQKIGLKIQEILDTGKLRKLDQYYADPNIITLNLLCRVTGVGPAAARKWIDSGVKTIEDLKKEKLTHHQQIGVKYFEDFEKRIPRSEMQEIKNIVKTTISQLDQLITVKICGSYRRGSESSGDVDVLITHPKFTNEKKEQKDTFDLIKRIVDKLEKIHFLTDHLANGTQQYMGVCKIPKEGAIARRIDIKLFPKESFFTALLHFTGSGEHNRQLSCIAINKGFKLSEFSISPVGSTGVEGAPLPVHSEKEIYDILGIPFRKPSERNI